MERLTVTKAAFRWARANAEQRGEDVVTSPDLLFGMIKAHPTDAEPLQLLDHARVPHGKLDDLLADWARGRTDSKDFYVKPRRPAPLSGLPLLDDEAKQATELAFELASRANEAEDGLVRLRDLFRRPPSAHA